MTELGDVVSAVARISEDERLAILGSAEQTMGHQFEYLGSGLVDMPSIRWHEDFKSGHRWKKGVFYLKQRKSTKKEQISKCPGN